MDLPLYDIGGLLEEEQITIEETEFTEPADAKADLEQRLRDGEKWSMCIIQYEHGMLMLNEDNEGKIHGVLYRPLICGLDSHSTRITAVILALLFDVGRVSQLYAGTLARYTHVIVHDLMSKSVSIELPD
ncbi:MAG TPA: hypothetical protein VFH06_05625 [Candidatus Saccharimonadales bacterium]|nr:hypothetical protein [Candidatus Saccharimonadales bacterium]